MKQHVVILRGFEIQPHEAPSKLHVVILRGFEIQPMKQHVVILRGFEIQPHEASCCVVADGCAVGRRFSRVGRKAMHSPHR